MSERNGEASAVHDDACQRLRDESDETFASALWLVRDELAVDALSELQFDAAEVTDATVTARVVPGSTVVLVGVPMPSGIRENCARVFHMTLPPPWSRVHGFLDYVPRVGARLWDAAEVDGLRQRWLACASARTRLVGEHDVKPLPPTAIAAGWRPLAFGSLSVKPKARRWLVRHPTLDGKPSAPGQGDGMLALGIAGLLLAAGGVGKTVALLQLAVAVVTGRRWLGHFEIAAEAVGRRVALILAEEDTEEIQRRLFNVCEAMGIGEDERRLVERQVIAVGLASVPCSMLTLDRAGLPVPTSEAAVLREKLVANAGDEGWALVVLDPLARLSAGLAESTDGGGTLFMQLAESLTTVAGTPTVLTAHHSSKVARAAGEVDSRGRTEIGDAGRWTATLKATGSRIEFSQTKSNYSRRMADPLSLTWQGGALRAVTDDEQAAASATVQAAAEAGLQQDVDCVVDALRKAGRATSIDSIVALAHLNARRGRVAVRLALDVRKIVKTGPSREPVFTVAPDLGPSERVCESPPRPPVSDVGRRAAGTAVVHAEGLGVPDVDRTSTGRRTSSVDDGMPREPGGRRSSWGPA